MEANGLEPTESCPTHAPRAPLRLGPPPGHAAQLGRGSTRRRAQASTSRVARSSKKSASVAKAAPKVARDGNAAIGVPLDEALQRQDAECFSDGRRADAQTCGELVLTKARALGKPAFDDLSSDGSGDEVLLGHSRRRGELRSTCANCTIIYYRSGERAIRMHVPPPSQSVRASAILVMIASLVAAACSPATRRPPHLPLRLPRRPRPPRLPSRRRPQLSQPPLLPPRPPRNQLARPPPRLPAQPSPAAR